MHEVTFDIDKTQNWCFYRSYTQEGYMKHTFNTDTNEFKQQCGKYTCTFYYRLVWTMNFSVTPEGI